MACMVSVGTVKPQIDCGAPSCQAGKYIISENNYSHPTVAILVWSHSFPFKLWMLILTVKVFKLNLCCVGALVLLQWSPHTQGTMCQPLCVRLTGAY